MSEEAAYTLRPYKVSDIPLIQSSWGSSYYKGARYKQLLSPKSFHQHHRPIREAILLKPSATIIVAAAKENTDLILGWMALEEIKDSENVILHYIYVKEAFKKERVSKRLLDTLKPKAKVLFTHQTDKALDILKRNPKDYEHFCYTPHLI